MKLKLALTALVSAALASLACANWTPQQKELACEGAFTVMLAPECPRLTEVNPALVPVCNDILTQMAPLVCSGDLETVDLIPLCERAEATASKCSTYLGGDGSQDGYNVATCERAFNALGLACRIEAAGRMVEEGP